MKWVLIAGVVLVVYVVLSRTIRKVKRKKAVERIQKAQSEKINKSLKDVIENDEVSEIRELIENLSREELEELIAWFIDRDDAVDKARSWVAKDPDSIMLKAVLGVALVQLAQNVRGGAIAAKLSTSQVMDYSVLLQEGKSVLLDVMEADESIPIIYTALINTALGLSDSELAWTVFEKLRNHYPEMFRPHIAMALKLTPKWGGSESDLMNFCREASAKDSTGKLSGLIPFAHNEMLLDYAMKRDMKGYMNYFKNDEVRKEIDAAYNKTKDKALDTDMYGSLNQFAAIYTQMSEKKMAKEVFERLGDNYTATPWHYESAETPLEAFLAAKQKASVPV